MKYDSGKILDFGCEMWEGKEQRGVTLSVISYPLFGISVAMRCLDDLKDFYDLRLTARVVLSLPVPGKVPGSSSNGPKGLLLTIYCLYLSSDFC